MQFYRIMVPLLGTLPITTAEAEHVFSKMARTASAICATMEHKTLKLCCYCRCIGSTRQLLKVSLIGLQLLHLIA